MSDQNIDHGSPRWPAVPPEPPRQLEPEEVAPLGSGWRAAVLIGLIAFLILGVAGYMALLARHVGGGR